MGVRLIRLDKDQKLSTIVAFEEEGIDAEDDGAAKDTKIKPSMKLDGADDQTMYIPTEQAPQEESVESNESAQEDPVQDTDTFLQF